MTPLVTKVTELDDSGSEVQISPLDTLLQLVRKGEDTDGNPTPSDLDNLKSQDGLLTPLVTKVTELDDSGSEVQISPDTLLQLVRKGEDTDGNPTPSDLDNLKSQDGLLTPLVTKVTELDDSGSEVQISPLDTLLQLVRKGEDTDLVIRHPQT